MSQQKTLPQRAAELRERATLLEHAIADLGREMDTLDVRKREAQARVRSLRLRASLVEAGVAPLDPIVPANAEAVSESTSQLLAMLRGL